MNFKLLIFLLDVVAVGIFAYGTWVGNMVPAWAALIWCISATLHDFANYLETL